MLGDGCHAVLGGAPEYNRPWIGRLVARIEREREVALNADSIVLLNFPWGRGCCSVTRWITL